MCHLIYLHEEKEETVRERIQIIDNPRIIVSINMYLQPARFYVMTISVCFLNAYLTVCLLILDFDIFFPYFVLCVLFQDSTVIKPHA